MRWDTRAAVVRGKRQRCSGGVGDSGGCLPACLPACSRRLAGGLATRLQVPAVTAAVACPASLPPSTALLFAPHSPSPSLPLNTLGRCLSGPQTAGLRSLAVCTARHLASTQPPPCHPCPRRRWPCRSLVLHAARHLPHRLHRQPASHRASGGAARQPGPPHAAHPLHHPPAAPVQVRTAGRWTTSPRGAPSVAACCLTAVSTTCGHGSSCRKRQPPVSSIPPPPRLQGVAALERHHPRACRRLAAGARHAVRAVVQQLARSRRAGALCVGRAAARRVAPAPMRHPRRLSRLASPCTAGTVVLHGSSLQPVAALLTTRTVLLFNAVFSLAVLVNLMGACRLLPPRQWRRWRRWRRWRWGCWRAAAAAAHGCCVASGPACAECVRAPPCPCLHAVSVPNNHCLAACCLLPAALNLRSLHPYCGLLWPPCCGCRLHLVESGHVAGL